MKLYLSIVEPGNFLAGNYDWCFRVNVDREVAERYGIYCGEIEVEINADDKTVRQYALNAIEETERETRAEFEVKMQMLREKKQNLLCIEHEDQSCTSSK